VDEDSIDPELLCAVCHCPFVQPVAHSMCNNMFCSSCIDGQQQVTDLHSCTVFTFEKCPLCRKLLTKDSLSTGPRPILNILDKLKVFCPSCSNVRCHHCMLLISLERVTRRFSASYTKLSCVVLFRLRCEDCAKGSI
jgi:hypothetical protein